MDDKTLQTLEYPKILEQLASYAAFEPSAEKARILRPTNNIEDAHVLLAETGEAVRLLATHTDISIGGARDIRELVDLAEHGGVLSPPDLLDIKYTLISARLKPALCRRSNALPKSPVETLGQDSLTTVSSKVSWLR